ncbi:MAG: phosphate/phosphite/phosphonate ABC transporter substrate-binding protein [Capsulimonas sp.]|uniref:phosphate/phosphite/phosphonate ABC transporter substrate-binding protein n=1 Tax=Capsulimonas sp. TaxID=2494211 RepID=UPI0032642560
MATLQRTARQHKTLRWTGLAMTALTAVVITGCSPKGSSNPADSAIRVGVIPFDKASVIQEQYAPLAAYLAKKTDRPSGKVFVTPEYAGVLQALRADQVDCAYLSPLAYVLAKKEFENTPERLVPIAMPYFHNKLTYQGIIFARADSGIHKITDFKGKSFVFADRTSASGYLYPAGLMKEAGLDPQKDVKAANITGAGSVLSVFNKVADGGASYEDAIEQQLKNPADEKQMVVIAKTEPIPNGMFVARGNLDPKTLAALQKAFVDINTDPDGQAAAKKILYPKWVPADDAFFDSVRKKASVLNISFESLKNVKKK